MQKTTFFSDQKIASIRRKISSQEIEEYNNRRFNIPILTETPQKGLYLSFEEFKNNTPSVTNYKVSPDKKTDDVYSIDEKGKETLLRNVYGYSDGKNIYLKSAGNFFKLYRSNNAFNLYGAKSLKKSRQYFTPEKMLTLGLNPDTFSKNNTKVNYNLKLNPYQVDLETGIIY